MAFEDIDDFKCIVGVTKENYIISERVAAQKFKNFWSGAPQLEGRARQFLAFIFKFLNKVSG